MPKPLLNEPVAELTTVERLGELMKLLKIKEAYYIDDYNEIDDLPYVQTISKTLFNDHKLDELGKIFGDHINLQVPSEDELGQQLNEIWDGLKISDKGNLLFKLYQIQEEEFSTLDFDRTRELQKQFPDGILKLVGPDGWSDLLNKLSNEYIGEEKVLLLFDQDLSKAKGERFRNKTIQGQQLILEIKGSGIRENVFCALITHLIENTSKELEGRNNIIAECDNKLVKTDFLALAKDRLSDPELFCDGIKKTLLNGYFEEIKEKSKTIIEKAQKESLDSFDLLDTYDFDHTILKSSFDEGVWEANTIFRITDNFFEEHAKKLMIDNDYAQTINPILKASKAISDIKFKVPDTEPYLEKYKLRHNDIYDPGENLNKLHSPIENGDIFEITEGTGKGFYILIGQECDLMMRNDGSRFSQIANFVKINVTTKEEVTKLLNNSEHYFANKFGLFYFNPGTTDIGVVSFNNTFSVNLNMLDLCVFNADGTAALKTDEQFNTNLLNTSWENRYNKMIKSCKSESKKLDELFAEMAKLNLKATVRDPILKKLYPNLGLSSPLGTYKSYSESTFNFGFKRVMRLKNFGAKYLLERYYRHLSRTAEPHDFAK